MKCFFEDTFKYINNLIIQLHVVHIYCPFFRKSAQVVKTSGIQLPSHWCDMGNEHFMKIAIKPGDDSFQNHEWENIQTKFESTLPQARIVSIQRIQNIFMWEHFFL